VVEQCQRECFLSYSRYASQIREKNKKHGRFGDRKVKKDKK